jgi:hypothetical protein
MIRLPDLNWSDRISSGIIRLRSLLEKSDEIRLCPLQNLTSSGVFQKTVLSGSDMNQLSVLEGSGRIFSDAIRTGFRPIGIRQKPSRIRSFFHGRSRFPEQSGIGSDVFRSDPPVGLNHLGRTFPFIRRWKHTHAHHCSHYTTLHQTKEIRKSTCIYMIMHIQGRDRKRKNPVKKWWWCDDRKISHRGKEKWKKGKHRFENLACYRDFAFIRLSITVQIIFPWKLIFLEKI